jgi:putative DNA primase/helicase
MTPYQERAVSLVEHGYRIIPIPQGEKRPVISAWQNYEASAERVSAEWHKNGNIGVLTAKTPAIDIDTLDAEMAVEMEQFVCFMLGETPIRVGRAPKRLMVFRADVPFSKRASGFFTDALGVDHQLEVLGEGQQFVAYGIHPDTRKPYQWVTMEALHDVRAADLPVLTAAGADAVIAEFVRLAEKRGWVRKSGQSSGNSKDDFWFLRPKPEATDEELEAAMVAFPNPGRDYDLWVKVGAALHDHTAGDERGFSLWDEWSSRSELYNEEMTRKKWTSFGRYTGQPVTIGFILAATRKERKVEEVKVKTTAALDTRTPLLDAIRACTDPDKLLGDIMAQVASTKLDPMSLEFTLKAINTRLKELKANTISIHTLKKEAKRLANNSDTVQDVLGLRLEKMLAEKVLEISFAGGAHLIFFSDLWWHYAGGVWRRTEENLVGKAIQDCVLELSEQNDDMALALSSAVAESRGDRLNAIVNTVLPTIRRIVGQDGNEDPLNLQSRRPPRVVNCTNGELWFDIEGNMTLKHHNPENRLTSQVACAYTPSSECPAWDAMCMKVFGRCKDPENMIRHFHEVFGYMIQPERHHAMAVLLKGPGGNGKSTLADVVREVMGQDTVLSFSVAELAQRVNAHFTDSCQGKLMLLDDDFKATSLLPDDWVKKFSEAKSMSANPKFGRPYEFIARCTPVILTNGWPQTVDLSDGLRRRMMVFEMNHKLTDEEKDPRHVIQVLDHELPGVLNRLVDGLRRVLSRGQRFDVPAECEEARDKWVNSSNPTARFVDRAVERTGSRSHRVPCSDLYDAYRQWCAHDEGNVRVLGRNKFYEAMEAMGLKKRNHSGVLVFAEITLKITEGVEAMFSSTVS